MEDKVIKSPWRSGSKYLLLFIIVAITFVLPYFYAHYLDPPWKYQRVPFWLKYFIAVIRYVLAYLLLCCLLGLAICQKANQYLKSSTAKINCNITIRYFKKIAIAGIVFLVISHLVTYLF